MKEKIDEIIKDEAGYDFEIKPESKLENDIELDSLDRVQLVMRLEQEFDIQVPDDKLEELETVQDVYDLIESLTE